MLIKKVFRQLIQELKSLGANIVYASVSRIILAIPKTHTIDSIRYAGFLEKTIKEKSLFRHINFQPLLGVYSGLRSVDRFNYRALPAPEETSILNGEVGRTQTQNLSSKRTYASRYISYAPMVWDMARYLPLPVAVLWFQVVEEFIWRPILQRLPTEEQEDAEQLETILEGSEETAIESGLLGDAERRRKKRVLRPRCDGFMDEIKMLTTTLTRLLLEKVYEFRENTLTLSYPSVPSTYSSEEKIPRNTALGYFRSLVFVLGLDIAATECDVGCRVGGVDVFLGAHTPFHVMYSSPHRLIRSTLNLYDLEYIGFNWDIDLDLVADPPLWS